MLSVYSYCIELAIYTTSSRSILNEGGAVAERLRHRSCDQNVASSIPRSGISVEVTTQC